MRRISSISRWRRLTRFSRSRTRKSRREGESSRSLLILGDTLPAICTRSRVSVWRKPRAAALSLKSTRSVDFPLPRAVVFWERPLKTLKRIYTMVDSATTAAPKVRSGPRSDEVWKLRLSPGAPNTGWAERVSKTGTRRGREPTRTGDLPFAGWKTPYHQYLNIFRQLKQGV